MTTIKPGIYLDMGNDEYHQGPGISKSHLDVFNKSPLDYKWRYVDKHVSKETPAMRLGTLVHTAVLEPDKWSEGYICGPECRKNSKQFKEFQDGHGDKEIISIEDWLNITAMAKSIKQHKHANSCIDNGRAEQSVFTKDRETELLLKCRPDWLRTDGMLIDLKTTVDASPESFRRTCQKFRYHVQAAWYMDICNKQGLEIDEFVFVVIEKTPPFKVAVYTLNEQSIALGREIYMHDLNKLQDAFESNEWPGYDEIIELSLPESAFNALRDENYD